MSRVKRRRTWRLAAEKRRQNAAASPTWRQASALTELVRGRGSRVVLNSGEHVPVYYAVVEAEYLITSHRGGRYQRDPRYPVAAQPRDYSAEKELQLAVEVRAENLDEWQILTDSVLPVDGPPVVRRDGVVISGNGRTQSIRLAMKWGRYGAVRAGILHRAGWFGFDASEAERLRQPVLVRVLESAIDTPLDLARYGLEMNRDPAQGLSSTEQALALARILDQATVAKLASIATSMPDRFSVRDFMRERALEIAHVLAESGLIDSRKRAEYLSESGYLTDGAKDLIESALAGLTISDFSVLRRASRSTKDKLARAGVAFLRMRAAGPQWDLARFNDEAVSLVTEAEEASPYLRTLRSRHAHSGSLVERLVHPERYTNAVTSLYGDRKPPHPAVEGLALALELAPREYVSILGEFADRCGSQQSIFLKVHPAEVFSATIGLRLHHKGTWLRVQQDEWDV